MDSKLGVINLIENFKQDLLNFIYGVVCLFFINFYIQFNILEIPNNGLLSNNVIFYSIVSVFAYLIGKIINFYSLLLVNTLIRLIRFFLKKPNFSTINIRVLFDGIYRFFNHRRLSYLTTDHDAVYETELELWAQKKNVIKKISSLRFDNHVIINLFGLSLFVYSFLSHGLIWFYMTSVSLVTIFCRLNYEESVRIDMLHTMIKDKKSKKL